MSKKLEPVCIKFDATETKVTKTSKKGKKIKLKLIEGVNQRYIINKNEKIVVYELTTDEKRYRGVAQCHEGDIFNEIVGKKISKAKALLKLERDRYKESKEEYTEYLGCYKALYEKAQNNFLISKEKMLTYENLINEFTVH